MGKHVKKIAKNIWSYSKHFSGRILKLISTLQSKYQR